MNITLHNVSKQYGRHAAVKDVSISLSPGKIYGLIGPNGSGKSTTLKMLAGLMFPTSGSVRADGKPVTRDMVRHRLISRNSICFIPGSQ